MKRTISGLFMLFLVLVCSNNLFAQTITLRFVNNSTDCDTGLTCFDVEAHADQPNVELDELNVRFFIDDAQMTLDMLQNPDPLYSLEFGNDSQQGVAGSGASVFGFTGEFIYVKDNFKRVGANGLILGVGPANWTYLFEACFNIDPSVDLSTTTEFCPSIVWDQNEAGTSGFANGSDGVQALQLNPAGGTALPLDEDVIHYNWSYAAPGGSVGGPTMDDCYDPGCANGEVCGHLYLDTNGNGMQDAGEPDLANVDVVVTASDGTTQTVTSDANGDYCATVPSGTTSVDVDETDPDYPAGSTQTEGTDPTVVTVNPGMTEDAGIDGYYIPAEICGHLYLDTNGNGMQDAGEPDLANVDVVVTASDGSTQTVTSDANGDYCAEVPPGVATVDVDETDPDYPADSDQTEGTDPSPVTAVAGTTTDAGIDGYYIPAEICGHLYLDTNGNGTQDLGEPDLANVDVVVTASDGSTQTVTSDANGDYCAEVPPGVATVDVDETDADYPADSDQTEGTDPSPVTAVAGTTTDAGIDGYYIPAEICGHLYLDTNGNGMQDAGEPDLANVDVVVTASDGSMQTVTSDANGDYCAEVPPGLASVDVDETDPDYPADSDQTEGTDPNPVTAVAGTTTDAGIDGYYIPAEICGHLYLDTNGNGMQDAGEPDLANVDVVITASDGSMQTVTSDANGDYCAEVPPGLATVDVDETDPDYPADSDQTEGTDPSPVTAVAGTTTDAGIDGYYIPAQVFGHIYYDTNGNGMQDAGEPDLPNVDVVITDSEGNTQTVTTDANGDYMADVPPGNTCSDIDDTDPDIPTPNTQTEGLDPNCVTAVAGTATDIGNDGYYVPAEICGHLYLDSNGNGIQDLGEPDLANVDVVVTASDGSIQTISSDANGDYCAEVPPGVTTVDVDETDTDYPTGSTQTEGTDPSPVTAVAGTTTDAGVDGYYIPAEICGHLYLDTNGNGMQDAGEPDLANVDVIVTGSDGVVLTVSSDADGDYCAAVPPGTTVVDVDETDADYPTGSTQTEGTDPNPVTAVAGTTQDAGIDGYFFPAEICGHLYFDENGNGMQDAGEPDIADVDVVITDSEGNMQTVTTDADGDYCAFVPPGTTITDVDETDPDFPADVEQTEGTDPSPVTAVGGTTQDAGNDGYYLPAEICGHLYFDTNGNGMQDAGEPDLANVDVIVTASDGSVQTVSSDDSGDYCAEVPPGTAIVDVDESDSDYPTGSTQTEGTDPNPVTAIAGTTEDAGIDGYYIPAEVFGHIYYDTNGNGMQDAGEPDLPNVDVVITDSEGNMQTVTTDANGDYSAIVPPGVTCSDIDETDPDIPSPNTQTEGLDPNCVTAVAGTATDIGNDGYYVPAEICGHLYLDANGNGMQDAGEPDLANVDVIVTASDGSVQTVTSDAAGDYCADVPPGTTMVDVDETDPDYPADSDQTEGTDPSPVTAVAGTTTDAGIDGYYMPAEICGHLYLDANGNGMQDAGEPDLANVDVVITASDGSMQTVSSDAAGDYCADVPPGTAILDVDETDPDFPADSEQTEGTDPSPVVAVAGTTTDGGIDGYYIPAEVCGHIYFDTNNNGMQDAGEPDLALVDVVITDVNGIAQTVTSDANGDYCAEVPPGTTVADIDETDSDFPADVVQTEGTDPNSVVAVAGTTTDIGIDGYTIPLADLELTKVVSTPTVIVGNTVTWTISIENLGPVTATNVEVTDDLPAGLNVLSSNASQGVVSGLVWTVGTLAPGQTETLELVTEVTGVGPYLNSAQVTASDQEDPDSTPNNDNPSEDDQDDAVVSGLETTVSGHLYLDYNNNGVQDAGEPDLPNVDVIITAADGTITTVTSDANGDWMESVTPGLTIADIDNSDPDYPTGYTQTEGNDIDFLVAVGGTDTFMGNDGYYAPASLFGHVYYDTNNNGMQDAGEPDLPNIDVIVTQSDGTMLTLTTDANGDYMSDVLPGTTVVEVDESDADFPAGANQTEGTNPNTVTAITNTAVDAGIDGYYRCITVETNVFLEGALIDKDGTFDYDDIMRTDLNDIRLLPGQTYNDGLFGSTYFPAGQPYNVTPWNYAGTEGAAFDSGGNPANADAGYPATVTDWVLVSLRTDIGIETKVCEAAALLNNDGEILFVEPFDCCDETTNEYYIVVEHRNHLIVMSPNPVPVAGGVVSFDFRASDSYKDGFGISTGQKMITTTSGATVFAMLGGNSDQLVGAAITDINVNDKVIWEADNNLFAVYEYADHNLSGDTNVNDKTLWEQNNNEFSGVPR